MRVIVEVKTIMKNGCDAVRVIEAIEDTPWQMFNLILEAANRNNISLQHDEPSLTIQEELDECGTVWFNEGTVEYGAEISNARFNGVQYKWYVVSTEQPQEVKK